MHTSNALPPDYAAVALAVVLVAVFRILSVAALLAALLVLVATSLDRTRRRSTPSL
jgi:hypothetical protein